MLKSSHSDQFVYIIGMTAEQTNFAQPPPELIKVGYTVNLDERRVTLNTGNPYKLVYVAIWRVKDAQKGEKVAHESLDGQSLRARPYYGGGYEWFMLPTGRYSGAQKLIQRALEDHQMLVPSKNGPWVSPKIENMDYKRRPNHK